MNKKLISFVVFADLHYKKGMYVSTVSDLEVIMERAEKSGVDMVIHAGDFSNDYCGSAEIVKNYIDNRQGLSVYGIYGNHELESKGNTMQNVTPLLTNRADEVIWGTENGDIGDSSIGYYYFDKGDCRIVCTDTNYSYNEELGIFEHNKEASWGPPSSNKLPNSLGPQQLLWLEDVLCDGAKKGKRCIVFSHATLNTEWGGFSPDAEKVVRIFEKANSICEGTVIMAINGHHHTNRIAERNGIVYFDVNTVRNGFWTGAGQAHYEDIHTFEYTDYDEKGDPLSSEPRAVNSVWQSKNTWFFKEPLSAVVEIFEDLSITIDGAKTSWLYDVIPPKTSDAIIPEISSYKR